MTIAICFNCGEFKHGAWTVCQKCGTTPKDDDELVKSLAMTDHYFDNNSLREMGRTIATGEEINIDPESRKQLLSQIHDPAFAKMLNRIRGIDNLASSKPWWKFW